MTEKLKQIVKEEILKLPKEGQEAINALDWGSIVEEIGKKYLLDEGEINDLQVETLLILVGIEHGNSYARNIENNLITSKNEAEKIAEEVIQKIFIPISERIEENIKNNPVNKNPRPEQNIDFILSGGNYLSFIENRDNLDS